MRPADHIQTSVLAIALLLCAAVSSAPVQAGESAEKTVDLRHIGRVTLQVRLVGRQPDRSSWTTLETAGSQQAEACASKYLEDLLGYGEMKPAGDGAPTRLSLAGVGHWALGLDGRYFHIVFARNDAALADLLATARATAWQPVRPGRHPRWMDTFDQSAMTFWFSGFGILPKDLAGDRRWYADNGFAACAVLGNTERRLIAPGVLDTAVMDWQSAQAAAYRTPYKIMADMATPARPESLWNYLPLPYYRPDADGQIAASSFMYQGLAIHAAFQAGAATDPHLMDFRRRVGERLKDDPWFIGHHVVQEMHGGGPGDLTSLAAVAGTPAIQDLWRVYLREALGFDLATVGTKHRGDPAAFRAWSEVGIPTQRELLGWDAAAIDLKGRWEGRPDRSGTAAAAERWQEGGPTDGWSPVDCQDLGLMLYNQGKGCDYYLRRTFGMPAGSTARYFHMPRVGDSPRQYDLWINGQKLDAISSTDPSCPAWDICYDAGKALKPGDNLIVINTRGIPIGAYAFIGPQGRWSYPGPSETINRRFFDAIGFQEWLVMRDLENRMIAIRAGDPYRPMKIMAPHNYIDRVLDLCARYGAYPHDTGGAGAWWGPFTYARYATTRGIPNSVEQGSVPGDAAEMQACISRYLMMGVDAVDNVGHVSAYAGDAGKSAWIRENRELLRCIGKQDLVQPSVGLLRCGRELRFGISDMYAWDMGRGPLPSIGRAFGYASFGDLRNGRAASFKVLLDCATTVMSEAEVDLVEQYVRQGGTFVAFHNTGVHTPEKAYAWPIARLTGLRVVNNNRPIGGTRIHFSDAQGLWPRLRGQEVNGWGLVLDWLKQDRTGDPIALTAQDPSIEVVAEWKSGRTDGSIAVASRAIGKGRVITLGSTFYRSGKDDAGRYAEPGTLPYLDELLTSLGVPRETTAGDLWCERWRSKNGLYDIYPVCQMNPKAEPSTTDVTVRCDASSTMAWELSALGHPARAVRIADGRMTIPQVAMTAMQSRVFAVPRADIELGALHWLGIQQRQSGALPALPASERQRATMPPADDVLVLADGWLSATGERDRAWIAPGFATTAAWRTVRLGSFAAMGLPEEAIAQFRREVMLPDGWAGQRVRLTFDCENWFWGITWRASLWINGQPAAIRQPLRPEPNGCFAIELTPEQASARPLVLALEVDGRYPDKGRNKARPSGVTGTFCLRAAPQPVHRTPLAEWSVASELNQLAAVEPGRAVQGLYLETRFALPATWPGRRLFLRSPTPLGSLILNNQFLCTPPAMTELDISGLVRREGDNVLRWVPATNRPAFDAPFKGVAPELSLMWLP